MGHSKENVVDTALAILGDHGLPGLSMRRLAATLGVQQSALYWHFDSKQMLLAAMAEKILRGGPEPAPARDWSEDVTGRAVALRASLLAYRDGAELVSTVYAFGLGADEPHRDLAASVECAGAARPDALAAATVILHFVFGFTFSEQQHLQASSVGAIQPAAESGDAASTGPGPDQFLAGLALVVDGIRGRLRQRSGR
jgi:TetR/AcrR family tetracycline transcriptional repressor